MCLYIYHASTTGILDKAKNWIECKFEFKTSFVLLSWPLALNKFRRGAHIKSNLLAGTEKAQQLDPGCSTPQCSSVLPSTPQYSTVLLSTCQFPSVEMEQQLACECTRGSNWSGDRIVAVQQRTLGCREDNKVQWLQEGVCHCLL